MTMHYTHVSDDTAKKATLYIGDDAKDAEFEVLAESVPEWVQKLVESMDETNWVAVRESILSGSG